MIITIWHVVFAVAAIIYLVVTTPHAVRGCPDLPNVPDFGEDEDDYRRCIHCAKHVQCYGRLSPSNYIEFGLDK